MSSRPDRYVRAIAMAIAGTAVVAGCRGGGGTRDEDLAGLVTTPAAKVAKIDIGPASRDSAELARALAQPWSTVATALGEHTVTIEHKLEVREGTTVLETLGETTTLVSAADGSYHATYANTADYGREVIYLAPTTTLYLRPRYARWHQRAPETLEEPATTRDQLVSVLAADFELVAHGAEISDKGAATEAGRGGRRLELKRAPSARPAPKQALAQRDWRDGAIVEELTGEVVLDEQTATPLRGRLDAAIAFVREGKRLTMRLSVTQVVTLTPAPAIAAPADDVVVATPERRREVDERNFLLQGIAPPVGKGQPITVPAAPTAPAPAPTAPAPADAPSKP